jgi:glucan endo-1,3-alpha-glucosidase
MTIKSVKRFIFGALALAAFSGTDAGAGAQNAKILQTHPDFRLPEKSFFKTDKKFIKDRKVFAWYMVCCGPFNGGWSAPVDQYKTQIQMAQSMGIDGFGLDVMRPNDEYKTAVGKMFQAAKELNSGFQLFFKFDYGSQDLNERTADIVHLMKTYGEHKHYSRVDGIPLAGYYALDCCVDNNHELSLKWWRDQVMPALKKNKLEVFLVPTTFEQARKGGSQAVVDATTAKWADLVQGMSIWQIQTSPLGGGLRLLERQAEAMHQAGKTWMTTVAFHYWWGSSRSVPTPWLWMPNDPSKDNQPNGKYYEHAGGKGLEMQWKSVIEVQKPEWVMLLTWNDYNESYIEPIDDYKKYPNGTTDAPLGWYKSMAGLDELNRYYIQWYKTGAKPTITADSLFYCYRTSSQTLKASSDKRKPVRIGNGPIGDDLYITTALTAPATLRVVSGQTTTEFSVPAGIHQTVAPFQVGRQIFSMWRNGKQVAAVEGEPVVDSIKFYSYWPTTGYVTAGQK